ncbi:MAG: hypothetical protein LBT01_01500 [Spirochaetaceae bacterium]|jgi:hypothetical protein|nr:hypothetical protein [Spirochaetaceae bacterium]
MKKMKNLKKTMAVLTVLAAFVTVFALGLGSCNAIADTSGLNLPLDTVWLNLEASKAELVGGVRTATLTLDFDREIAGLTDDLKEDALNKLFAFRDADADSPSDAAKIKVTQVKKTIGLIGAYTLTVGNVPESTEEMVLVKIIKTGITPTTRPWFLDGKAGPPATQGATAVTGSEDESCFYAVAKDADGNTYAVGYQREAEEFTYGAGVSVQGGLVGTTGAVIVKYDKTGVAKWARVVQTSGLEGGSTPQGRSVFDGVAVDGAGGIYVVGRQTEYGVYTYGPGVSLTNSSSMNAVIAKYDGTGAAKWAKAITSEQHSRFAGVAADGKGNVYAVGYQLGDTVNDYGDGKTAQGGSSSNNAVIVQFNSNYGTVNWARSVKGIDQSSEFSAVAADDSGNAYAVGTQSGAGKFVYDGGGSVTGASDNNAVIVKYGSTGSVQWAQAASGGDAEFAGVALDGQDGIYVSGYQQGTGAFTYGTNAKSATGGAMMNAVLVKYTAAGTVQWATAAQGAAMSMFSGVAADGIGNVYAVGVQGGNEACDYTGASATGEASSYSACVVQYDSGTGAALWAQSVSGANDASWFYGVAADGRGNITTVGSQNGDEVFDYGNGITTQGSCGNGGEKSLNAVIVWYK